jgi:tight adherence protein C
MEWLVIVLIFCCVATLTLGVVSFVTTQSKARKRLTRLSDGTTANIELTADPDTASFNEPTGILATILDRLAGSTRSDSEETDRTRLRLVQAGYRQPAAFKVYQGSRIACALVLPMVLIVMWPALGIDELRFAVLACGSSALGLVIPSMLIDRRANARRAAIVRGLPDALDLMVVCVEAGLGISACLSRIAMEFSRSNPILSAEFELVTLESRAGKTNAAALRGLAQRTGVAEVSSLVAMLVQTERFGTSLADTLRVHSDDLRIQRLQRAEELAAKIPLKMLFPTVIIFIASMIVTIGPGMMELMKFFGDQSR